MAGTNHERSAGRGVPSEKDRPAGSRVALYDIQLRSLAGVEPGRLAAELVELKLVSSAEAAKALLWTTPATLARYVAVEAASSVCESLKAAGADVYLHESHVTCPHCDFSLRCEGEASQSGRGVIFSCPACHGLIFLDLRDHKFHPLLRCGACGGLLNLPAQAQPGKYRCKCGELSCYAPARSQAQEGAQEGASRVTPRVAILAVVLFLLVAAWASLLPIPGLAPRWTGASEPARAGAKPLRTTAYLQFHGGTDHKAVIAALGPPERESATGDGTHQVLFYRRYDLYVILEKSGAAHTYTLTVRISDGIVLHELAES